MTVWRKGVTVAIDVTQCFDVAYLLPRRITLSPVFCRNFSHSQPWMSVWAGVLEVWTWTVTYYSPKVNTQMGHNAPKYTFQDRQMTTFSREGHCPVPVRKGTPVYPTPYALGAAVSAPAAPLFLRLSGARLGPQTQILDPPLYLTGRFTCLHDCSLIIAL